MIYQLKPLVACPHSPDKVVSVSSLKGIKVNQIVIGSCTNSSYIDLMKVAKILEGKTIAENISLVIAPGSRRVLSMLAKEGAYSVFCELLIEILKGDLAHPLQKYI